MSQMNQGNGVQDGVLDLASIRNEDDVVAGFGAHPSVFITKLEHNGTEHQVQLPALDLQFQMLNGKVRHRLSITPDLVMPMIHVLAQWKVQLERMQQGAPPPAPPEETGRGPGA